MADDPETQIADIRRRLADLDCNAADAFERIEQLEQEADRVFERWLLDERRKLETFRCMCGDQKGVHLQDGCGICKKCKDFELDPSRPPATASNISHWNVHLVSTASDEPCVNCGDAYVMHDAAGCHQNTRLEHCPCPGFVRKAARL